MNLNKNPLLLIVDDEPFNVDFLEQELEDMGYATISAANGEEALTQAAKAQPDMILLDIMMPVMDGFEVLAKLKENPEQRDIPVIIISAASDMGKVVKGIEMGAEDYLAKPFDPVLLQARIRAGLKNKQYKDIEKAYLKALEREFEIGREMQAGFLPKNLPKIDGWEIASFFQPARNVAGDFYDVFEIAEEGKIGILVGDVCDKGVGAALYMTLFRSLVRALFWNAGNSDGYDYAEKLSDVIAFVNTYICEIHDSASFATLFFGVLDKDSGHLEYVSAGHDPPIIVKDGEIKSWIKPTGPLVGMLEGVDYTAAGLTIGEEETLFIFTDGLVDSLNANMEQFGQSRFEKLLTQSASDLQQKVTEIRVEVSNFIGKANQFDDLTLVAIRKS
ncbi:MAG: SpoIIE family protein phosphatase [Anaerolineae bacterium]|nr:SpoIIE family protein phosphatase [Anaerolineae bacterium]